MSLKNAEKWNLRQNFHLSVMYKELLTFVIPTIDKVREEALVMMKNSKTSMIKARTPPKRIRTAVFRIVDHS